MEIQRIEHLDIEWAALAGSFFSLMMLVVGEKEVAASFPDLKSRSHIEKFERVVVERGRREEERKWIRRVLVNAQSDVRTKMIVVLFYLLSSTSYLNQKQKQKFSLLLLYCHTQLVT